MRRMQGGWYEVFPFVNDREWTAARRYGLIRKRPGRGMMKGRNEGGGRAGAAGYGQSCVWWVEAVSILWAGEVDEASKRRFVQRWIGLPGLSLTIRSKRV